MTEWIQADSGKGRIGVAPPCDGSLRCAGSIHIHRNEGSWTEIHLTRSEIRRVRKALKVLLKEN